MSERAIDKMVKELEAELASHEDRYGRELTRHHIERARRLAKEEAKEKPTAPASLVEELNKWANDKREVAGVFNSQEEYALETNIVNGENYAKDSVLDILSRYRPSPQADIVGELRKYKEGLCYQASCCGIGVPRELKTRIEELDRVIEIIRKNEGAK